MIQSDWLRKLIFTSIATAVIALILNAPLSVWREYSQARVAYRDYQEQTERYKKESAEKMARACENIIPSNPALRDCLLAGIVAYQQDDMSKKDLIAQQDMARWALWLLIVSAISLLISIGGLWAIFFSLKQTREAISTDREVGHAQVRSYVAIRTLHERPLGPDNRQIDFEIANTGQSPARRVKYVAGVFFVPYPLDASRPIIQPKDNQVAVGIPIAPATHIIGSASIEDETTFDIDITSAASPSTTRRLCFVARVFYEDVFQKAHETSFCATAEFAPIKNSSAYLITWIPEENFTYET